ncbi:MAG: 2-hydroxyacyl-CoA dehydratase, partial [Candidatus Thiodiazotropha sp.]
VRTDLALALEMAKDEGYAVVGCLCSYTPVELIHAAGAIPIGLCGTTLAPIAKAEEILSADQCPKVKATFGRAVSGTCPLFPLADCILAETTCDGRKKMYELLERHKPMCVMDLPQKPEAPEALPAWRSQVEKAQQYLEAWLEVSIGKDDLRRAIRLTNRERTLKHAIFEICAHRPPPIMGLALTETLTRIGHRVHIEERINGLEALLETLPEGDTLVTMTTPKAGDTGMGFVDGWRGEVISFVRFGAEGRIARFFPRDPSWFTWPALERLIMGNIVADFPVCNKSVNGSYSGQDL